MNIDSLRELAKEKLPERARRALAELVRRQRGLRPRHRFAFGDAPDPASESPFAFAVDRDNELEVLGAKYQPTKRLHNYLPYYWMHFRDIRTRVRSVLEIGVQTDRSIRMWEEFFPKATIFGLDIDPACERFSGGRRRIFTGDQGDGACLRRVVEAAGGSFDIVIDDGSHRVEHQLSSFETLFPRLSEHGIYVVEDTGGCVGDPGLATAHALASLVDSIMYWPRGREPSDWLAVSELPADARWIDANVVGIAFYRWIVFVMRGRNPGDNPFLTARGDASPAT